MSFWRTRAFHPVTVKRSFALWGMVNMHVAMGMLEHARGSQTARDFMMGLVCDADVIWLDELAGWFTQSEHLHKSALISAARKVARTATSTVAVSEFIASFHGCNAVADRADGCVALPPPRVLLSGLKLDPELQIVQSRGVDHIALGGGAAEVKWSLGERECATELRALGGVAQVSALTRRVDELHGITRKHALKALRSSALFAPAGRGAVALIGEHHPLRLHSEAHVVRPARVRSAPRGNPTSDANAYALREMMANHGLRAGEVAKIVGRTRESIVRYCSLSARAHMWCPDIVVEKLRAWIAGRGEPF